MEVDSEKIILLSIKPRFAEDILSGRKKWEYRRAPPKITIDTKLILYACDDLQAIVGDCIVVELLQKPINELIDQTIKESTSTRERLLEYFSGLAVSSALRIEKPQRYINSIPLSEIREKIPNFTPPQNFYYLRRNDKKYNFIFKIVDLE